MESVNFPKPRRFDVFKMMYIKLQMEKHRDNEHWDSVAKTYENLGGVDALYDLWGAFQSVSTESQKRIIGFTNREIDEFLASENASRDYAYFMSL